MPVRVRQLLGLNGSVNSHLDSSNETLCNVGLIHINDVDDSTPTAFFILHQDGIVCILGSIFPSQRVFTVGRNGRKSFAQGVVEEDLTRVVAQTSRDKCAVVGFVAVFGGVGSHVDVYSATHVPAGEDCVEGYRAV